MATGIVFYDRHVFALKRAQRNYVRALERWMSQKDKLRGRQDYDLALEILIDTFEKHAVHTHSESVLHAAMPGQDLQNLDVDSLELEISILANFPISRSSIERALKKASLVSNSYQLPGDLDEIREILTDNHRRIVDTVNQTMALDRRAKKILRDRVILAAGCTTIFLGAVTLNGLRPDTREFSYMVASGMIGAIPGILVR